MYVIQLMYQNSVAHALAGYLKSARLVHCAMTRSRRDIRFTTYLYRHVSIYGLVHFDDTG